MLKKIENEDKTKKYDTFYLHSKAKTIINDSDIDVVFESIYTTILWNTQKSLGKGSSWITASFIEHNTIISMSSLLVGSSYIKSPKELDYSRTVLTYIQNIDDNEYFKWSLVRYLNPLDHHPARMTKCDKGFGKRLDCKCIKLPVKIRDIQKIEKKPRIPLILLLLVMKIRKNIQFMHTKMLWKKHVDLLLIGEEDNRHYDLIKYFNTFMYDHTLHRGKKFFTSF